MQLSTAIKAADGSHRVASLDDTYQRAHRLMALIGYTLPRDLTDHVGVQIPVWSVERQHHDTINTISYGKGMSHQQARVSAMMEAVERYSATQLPETLQVVSYGEMACKSHLLDTQHSLQGVDIHPETLLSWLPGTDLATGKEIWVPTSLVLLSPNIPSFSGRSIRTSNGIASGNTLEEAVCHGLCEMIERDAWTLAWLQYVITPHIQMMAQQMTSSINKEEFYYHDDSLDIHSFPEISPESLPDDVRQCVNQFIHIGMTIVIRDITSDIGIPTFLTAAQETVHGDQDLIHYGIGTHPHAHVAVLRAVTECAQSRQVNLRSSVFPDSTEVARQQLLLQSTKRQKDFSSIETYNHYDIMDDIHTMCSKLDDIGLSRVIAIELTRPELGFPVVRILIPGIEDWSAVGFNPKYSVLGYRGREYFDSLL